MARAGPHPSQEPGVSARSAMWVQRSVAACAGAFLGSWIRSGAAAVWTVIHVGCQHHGQCLSTLCHGVSPKNLIFNKFPGNANVLALGLCVDNQ